MTERGDSNPLPLASHIIALLTELDSLITYRHSRMACSSVYVTVSNLTFAI